MKHPLEFNLIKLCGLFARYQVCCASMREIINLIIVTWFVCLSFNFTEQNLRLRYVFILTSGMIALKLGTSISVIWLCKQEKEKRNDNQNHYYLFLNKIRVWTFQFILPLSKQDLQINVLYLEVPTRIWQVENFIQHGNQYGFNNTGHRSTFITPSVFYFFHSQVKIFVTIPSPYIGI